jgi:hypothetical protein
VEASVDVWVFWECNRREDVSRVLNLGPGGLFIQTAKAVANGVRAKLNFLVPEGQIRADAVIRHAQSGKGLGLKFTSISEQDAPHLSALLTRLRRAYQARPKW